MQAESTRDRSRWFALAVIALSLLIISLDNTVLNVALPSISRDLGATASELQWIVDAYILVFAALLLTMGAVGDKVGRKRALQFGTLWFGIFSVVAALSTSTTMLIATRALLGLGGALIMPATLSLITAIFRDPAERAKAIAVWAGVFGLGIGVGPLIGGWLIEHFEWSAVFLVNVPVVTVALISGHFLLPESKDERAPRPDLPGVLLSVAGLFALVYGIIQAGVDGWGATHVLIGLGTGLVILSIFLWWESRAPQPMLPLYLFRNMSFTGANLAITLVSFGMFGAMFFMSQYFQSVQGYTALQAGLRLLPQALVIMVGAGLSARIRPRLGIKVVVGAGFLIAASGMLYLSQRASVGASYPTVLLGLAIIGLGMGTAMSPATDSIMGSVPVRKAGIGSAMNDTTRQIGGALGVAVLGTLMNHTYLHRVAHLERTLPPPAYTAVSSSIQGAHMVAARLGAPGRLISNVADRAFVSGMNEAMLVASVILAAAALFVFAVLPAETRCIEPECQEEEAGRRVTVEAHAIAAD